MQNGTFIFPGNACSPRVCVFVGSLQHVNQRWLPHSTVQWALQPKSASVAESFEGDHLCMIW